MKLSEAMMLGATAHGVDGTTWEGCLLGVSVKAVGGNNTFNLEALARWPWIRKKVQSPEHLGYTGASCSAETLISGLAIRVMSGEVTLEQVVDWVRSVEPVNGGAGEVEVAAQGWKELQHETL
jgi:hypothetical protein